MERQKITKDIGALKGQVLVFGGVYSNLQALIALKEEANNKGIAPDHIICTGDVVGYCAQPEECVQLIKDWGIHVIAGNVEIQLREAADNCGCDFNDGSRCDVFSRNWYQYAQKNVSDDSIAWMNTLPDFIAFTYAGQKGTVVHGSYFDTSEYIFKSTDWLHKQRNFEATDSSLILAGHCGLPFSDKRAEGLWLNAGVIGMPANDGYADVWYLTLDDNDSKLYQFHNLKYDNVTASKLMNEHGLPEQYAKTLLTGIWDNCEILPDVETFNQGEPIQITY